jgi:hypothetical protein
MKADRQAMLDAHVQFELQRLQGKHLHLMLKEEVTALYAWLDSTRLDRVVSSAQLLELVRHVLVETPISPATVASLTESVQVAFEFLQEDATPLEKLVPRPLFDRIITSAVEQEALRHEITHQIVNSSVYTMLISNVLYHGIKGFVLTENGFAQKIPGASSLLKFGQNALNAASPQAEKQIDSQLIRFIHDNIQETVRESERFLNGKLDEHELRKVADEVWATNAASPVSRYAGYLHANSISAFVAIAVDFWRHFRKTPFLMELLEQIVHNLMLQHGKKPIGALLAEIGLTPDVVVQQIYPLAAGFAAQAASDGYLEERIRLRLTAFYAKYP